MGKKKLPVRTVDEIFDSVTQAIERTGQVYEEIGRELDETDRIYKEVMGEDLLTDNLKSEMRRYNLGYGRLRLVEVEPAQKKNETGDKSIGRKPSATTSQQQEYKTMVTEVQHEQGNKKNHNPRVTETDAEFALHELDKRLNADQSVQEYRHQQVMKALDDLRSPFSTPSLIKAGIVVSIGAALTGAVLGVRRLFWSAPEVVPVKPVTILK